MCLPSYYLTFGNEPLVIEGKSVEAGRVGGVVPEGGIQVIIKGQKDTSGVKHILLILILMMLSWMSKYGKISNCTI